MGYVSNIFEIFDIWLVTCLILYTYDGLRVEYFWNFRHMAGVQFPQPLTLRRAGGSFLWVRRLVSLSANRGIFRVFFFLKICAPEITMWKKTVLRAFPAILSPFMSISCDAGAGDAISLFVRGANLWWIASSRWQAVWWRLAAFLNLSNHLDACDGSERRCSD